MNRGIRTGRNRGQGPAPQSMDQPEQGPLMTEHLHNLELELELLKRKREMIEHQQQLIQSQRQMSIQRPHELDQPRYYEQEHYDQPPSSSNRNFSHLYDPAESRDFIPLNSNRKRPVEHQWTADPSPKRFFGSKQGNVKKSFGSRLGPRPTGPNTFQSVWNEPRDQPRPLMGLNSKPPAGYRLEPKPKPARQSFRPTKVTKPHSAPAPNKLKSHPVAERKNLVAEASHLAKKVDESMVLRADREPSKQLTGRLELALGQILKDIKQMYGERPTHAHIFQHQHPQRLMKQIIRERIRNMMMGKLVGTFKEILAAYRAIYPVETDTDIVASALAADTSTTNVKKYGIKLVESDDPEKYFKTNTAKLLDVKLREMFNKLVAIYANPVQKQISEEKAQSADGQDTKDTQNEDFTKDLTEDDVKDGGGDDAGPVEGETKTEEKYKFSIEQLDQMIQWRLPRILHRFKPMITKMLSIDQMYEATRAAIIMKTNSKAMALVRRSEKKDSRMSQKDSEDTAVEKVEKPLPKEKPIGPPRYFAKIFGRPSLPKRKMMQTFLDKFNPKTIKKHKNIHHLLFVGFVDKESLDQLLAENGVVVGKSTLEIKVSESRQNQNENKSTLESTDDDVQIIEDENKPVVLDDTLNSELEEQITDLLSSIRQAEEGVQSGETEANEHAVENDANDLDKAVNENAIPEANTEMIDVTETQKVDEENESQNDNNENEKETVERESDTQNGTNETNATVSDGDKDTSVKQDEVITNDENTTVKSGETTTSNEKATEEGREEPPSDKVVQESEEKDVVGALKGDKECGRSTPTRASARLANVTPSTIKTRRASKLAQN